MRTLINLTAIVFLLFSFSCHARSCTVQESIKIEKLVYEQRNWKGIYNIYLNYPECSSNNIVEVWSRYSEVIAGLLANHWTQFEELLKLTRTNKDFKNFVLSHVSDQTLPEDILKKITLNVKTKCPTSGRSFCAEIEKAAE